MPDLTYKDRLIIKAHNRINRLKKERMTMLVRSPEWNEKTYIKDLREINIKNHSNREQVNGQTLDS